MINRKKKYSNASAGGSSSHIVTDMYGNYSYDGKLFYDKDGNEVYVLDNYNGNLENDNGNWADSVSVTAPKQADAKPPSDVVLQAAAAAKKASDALSKASADKSAAAAADKAAKDAAAAPVGTGNSYTSTDPTISQQNDSLKSIKSLIDILTKFQTQAKQSNANSSAIINALKQVGSPDNKGLTNIQNNRLQDGSDASQSKVISGNYQIKDIQNFIDLLISNYTYVSNELEQQLTLEGLLSPKTDTKKDSIKPKNTGITTISNDVSTPIGNTGIGGGLIIPDKKIESDVKNYKPYYYMGAGLVIIGVSIFLMLKNK